VVDGALNHERVGNLMAELAPASILAAVAPEAADEVVQRAPPARAQLLAQGRLILVEAVAHGDAHLLAGALDLLCDAHRRLEGVGDGLLGEDVEVVVGLQASS